MEGLPAHKVKKRSLAIFLWPILAAYLLLCACGGPSALSSNPGKKQEPAIGVMWQGVENPTMPCDWIRIFSGVDRPALAYLFRSYGESWGCLETFFSLHSTPLLHVYASNGVCPRKGNCGPREALELPEVIQNALDLAEYISKACPHCELQIVPQLEDNFTAAEACHVAQKIRDGLQLLELPQYEIWRNPNTTAALDSADCFDGIELHEFAAGGGHLLSADRCAYSNDGADLELAGQVWDLPNRFDVPAIHGRIEQFQHCNIIFWSARGNCIHGDTRAEPVPANRHCGPLDAGIIKAFNDLLLGLQ